MIDDETIEVLLAEGTLPGTEDTLTLPQIEQPLVPPEHVPPEAPAYPTVPPLPARLMGDPILQMAKPEPQAAFDTYFHDHPSHIPGRPLRGPRLRITWRDHVLAGLAATTIVMSMVVYIEVRSGWRADMPHQADQVSTRPLPWEPEGPQDPAIAAPSTPASSPISRGVPVVGHGPSRIPHTPYTPTPSPRAVRKPHSAPQSPGDTHTPTTSLPALQEEPSPSPDPSGATPDPGTSPEPPATSPPGDTGIVISVPPLLP